MGGLKKIILTGLIAFTQASHAQGLRPAARDVGGMIPSGGRALPTGSGTMTYESIETMHIEQRRMYIEQRDNAYRAQAAAAQPAPSTQSSMDPSMLALLSSFFKNTDDDKVTPVTEYTPEEIQELYEDKKITLRQRDRILSGEDPYLKLDGKRRVKVTVIRPQPVTEDLVRRYNSEPRPEICNMSGVKEGEHKVGGVTLPCEAIRDSLKLINDCKGSFPNKNFIVVNDYSRLDGQKSFRSWLIPIARDSATQDFVVANKTDVSTGKTSSPQWFPLSNGKMRPDGHFCTQPGDKTRDIGLQTPAGYHISNFGSHPGPLRVRCKKGVDCNLPGGPSGFSPKIGMVGIEPDHNPNSLTRGILMHSGVTQNGTVYAGKPGASEGCSVVTPEGMRELWESIGGENGGALVNNYLGPDAKAKVCGRDKENIGKFDQKLQKQKCAAIKLAASKQDGTNKLMAKMNSSPTPLRQQAATAPIERNPASDAPPVPTAALTKPRPDAKTQ